MGRSQHDVPNKSRGWEKVSGGERAIKHTETKRPAIDIARVISRNQKAELVIQNKNVRIAQKDSHGHGPASFNR